MNEFIQVDSTQIYSKGELKHTQEQPLEILLNLDPETKSVLLAEVHLQLERLATHTRSWKGKSSQEQIGMVLEAHGEYDMRVARTHSTQLPSLIRYRRDVSAATAFVLLKNPHLYNGPVTLTQRAKRRYDQLEELDQLSLSIDRKLGDQAVQARLAEFPHVVELLRGYQYYTDVTPLLTQYGITSRTKREPNDVAKSFLFGHKRPGSTREQEGVIGIWMWARKIAFAKWLNQQTDYWGNQTRGINISQTIAKLINTPITRRYLVYDDYHYAKRFFQKILEMDFLASRQHPTPEFELFFPSLHDGIPNKFAEVDTPAAYGVFARHHTVPYSLFEFLRAVIGGEEYTVIGRSLPGGDYYSEETRDSWMRAGLHFLERYLVLKRTPGHPANIFLRDSVEKLTEAKRKIVSIS